MNLLDIPGFADAVAKERFIRDSAFLGLPETVAGFELRPLTLRDYILLRITQSPLLFGGTPNPTQLAQFLWAQSVEYRADGRGRDEFLKRCRKFVPPSRPLLRLPRAMKRWSKRTHDAVSLAAEIIVGCRAFIDEAMLDAPASRVTVGFNPEYHSSVCFWVALFNFTYTPEQVLNMPVKVLFQFLQERKASGGGKTPMFNRLSDGAKNQWLIEQNTDAKRN